ncbi:MAG: hypothetical protein KGO96_13075 [Elusimicrobia bacterium]|nr:hypothetical protein [Elusimicrobiota bacterium]MDE2426826.1 hypothetical protein [Elusimicrobiota bacterium]
MSGDDDGSQGQPVQQRHDPRISGIQKDVDLLKEGVAKILETVQEQGRKPSLSMEPDVPPIMQTQGEQDAFEEVRHRSTKATTGLLKSTLNYGAVYDLNATIVSTDSDLSHWLWIDVMDILKRRDKLKALLEQVGRRTFTERFGKWIPWIILGFVGGVIGYSVLQPQETGLIAGYLGSAWSDQRFQLATIAAVLIAIGAGVYYWLKARRDRRPKTRVE